MLSFFDVSYNQLEGRIPQRKQFNSFESNQYEGNLGLCRAPLKDKCGNFKASQPLLLNFSGDEETESQFKLNWMMVLMSYESGLVIGVVAGLEVIRRKHDWFMKTCPVMYMN